jgi:hypothetical protein
MDKGGGEGHVTGAREEARGGRRRGEWSGGPSGGGVCFWRAAPMPPPFWLDQRRPLAGVAVEGTKRGASVRCWLVRGIEARKKRRARRWCGRWCSAVRWHHQSAPPCAPHQPVAGRTSYCAAAVNVKLLF